MTPFESFYDYFSTWTAYGLSLLIAFGAGLLLALTYIYVKKGESYVRFTPVAILMVAPAMAALVGLLNARNAELEASDAVRVGVVLTAGVALTRFRSDKLRIEDLLYLVFSSVLGIVFGLGYATYGGLTAMGLVVVLFVLHLCHFGENGGGVLSVRMKVPEELNDEAIFAEAFKKHCATYFLSSCRTVEYGQLYELRYDVTLKKGESIKTLVDELRIKNANLEIVVSLAERE
jgi:hypothetical protein